LAGALSVPLLLAGALTGISPAAASAASLASPATCTNWATTNPVNPPVPPGEGENDLSGVAVLSATNTWAVGSFGSSGSPAIEHWNGAAWSAVTVSHSAVDGSLAAVGAVSPTDIWAVGWYDPAGTLSTYIVHWNGTAWTHVASPSPGVVDSELNGIQVLSANDIWAAGDYTNTGGVTYSLILHWNGKRWSQVHSPNPAFVNYLYGVTATSSSSAWAVGRSGAKNQWWPFIVHWNGASWQSVPAPKLPGTSGELLSVDATSTGNVWAVGDVQNVTGQQTLILHWNGSTWTRTTSPDPGGSDFTDGLAGVAATSAANAWAVGYTQNTVADYQSLILHWNGKSWARATSPSPDGYPLSGVGASSPANAWTVGEEGGATENDAVALHC
jgi:hypothetical protein